MPSPTQEDKNRMQAVLDKLWQNPALQSVSIARKESQILIFLRDNQVQLQKVMQSAEYFPHMSWDDTLRLLLSELIEKLIETVSPRISRLHENLIQEDLLRYLEPAASLEADNLRNLIERMMRVKVMRDSLLSVIEAVSLGLFERYMPPALESRKTIFIELVRRDRLEFDAGQMAAFLSLSSLFRPLYHYRFKSAPNSGKTVSLSEMTSDGRMFEKGITSLSQELNAEFGKIPLMIYKAGLESNVDANDRPETSGAAHLIAIMVARAADFDPTQKTDRGAESPDKSWFNIARRNAKYHGFDSRLLEELYLIAGERGW